MKAAVEVIPKNEYRGTIVRPTANFGPTQF